MKATSANGVEGCLIYAHVLGKFFFRVYDADYNFKDYDILHSDLVVTINDADAFFYEGTDGELQLDHSPATLGIAL
jgi:hypothetical protein